LSTESSPKGLDVMALQPMERRPCAMAAALEIVGERWSLVAIRELVYGVHRFDQIAAYTGATRDILVDRLRKLEQNQIIERRMYSEHPPRYEYHLTDKGMELIPVLITLNQWGTKWARPAYAPSWSHECGHSLRVDLVCHDCGDHLSRRNVQPEVHVAHHGPTAVG
jgi:DNA-binding HxlR family transcriptional regulator